MVQVGRGPADSKAISAVGRGAREIRVRDEARAFRVIWVASFGDVVYVLHAFQKKTPRTSRSDLELAARRYRQARALAEAEPFRDEVRTQAERLAHDHGLTIEFIQRGTAFRKEERIKALVAQRGDHPGLVHIFSAMESCPSYRPWHDKRSGKTFLKPTEAKCLHDSFYFIDPTLGLCYLRVPTWAPFRLQFYCNGHSVLARQLERKGIAATLLDNAFVEIADWTRAQALADAWDPHRLHRQLDRLAATYCPALRDFPAGVHWSCMLVEYAQDDLGNDFSTRIQGTRIKHHMGPAALKLYDKFGLIARIECTVNDVAFFQHHRTVEHRNGTREFTLAPVRKSIHSLPVLRGEFAISGFRARQLRDHLPGLSGAQLSRLLKRLRLHMLLKKIGKRYKHYLTTLGRTVATAALKMRELVIIPMLNQPAAA